jgi:pimeloyl-ACP methyl ester carboxylesterase
LREALGYPQINLVAVGAGGRVAVAAMGEPAGIRAVILDSPLPPDALSAAARAAALRRALNRLAGACAAQPTCAAAYPELLAGDGDAAPAGGAAEAEPAAGAATSPQMISNIERQLADILIQLDAEPLVVNLPRSGDSVPMDGRRLLELLDDAFSYPPALPFLPQLLHELAGGETALLGAMLESVPRTAAVPAAAAGVCAGWSGAAAEVAGDEPLDLLTGAAEAGLAALCGSPAEAVPPPAGDVPLLILNGMYDPITEPAWGAAVAARSNLHFQVTLPGLGFGVLEGDRCAGRLAAAFLSAPGTAPAAACVENLLTPPFTTP